MTEHQHLSLDGRETSRTAGQSDEFERLALFVPAPEQIPGQTALLVYAWPCGHTVRSGEAQCMECHR